MSRKAERNTLVHKEDGVAVEQTSIYDDNLLPPAEELSKLKELDPDIINWVKRRTEIEQDARIKFNMDKIRLMEKDMNQVTVQNIICICLTFIFVMAVLLISTYYVYKGLNVEGTVLGSSSILLAVLIFLKWRKGGGKSDNN